MITVISTIKTTIKTHITTTRLATRGALIALFAGLFILAACGGGGGVNVNLNVNGGAACTDPFAEGCSDAVARAAAITACRLLIEDSQACPDTIPNAVRVCLTDPYACDAAAYNTAIRTPDATVAIEALRTGRTNDCRGRTLAGVSLCNGAIVNTCQPISVATNASRNQLILDNLCNNAPNYITERTDFIADCTDRNLLNNVGCTPQIVNCADTPFNTGCDVDVYDSYRAVACHASSAVSPQCGSIITNYCTNNIFGARAGCSTNPAFASARITECITGTNGRSARCQNERTFTTAGLVACFKDPYGTGCDTVLGDNLNVAQNNHKTYCTGLGVRAGDNTLCDDAIENVCTGNIFDALCFAANYQTARENACRMTDSDDVRCPATVAQLCATNPFTQTTGGGAGYLCTDVNSRVALVARCAIAIASDAGGGTECDVSVGRVTLSDCIDDPYTQGCNDAVFNEMKTARYAHCTNDVRVKNCMGVEAIVCISGSQGQARANPFHTLCRNSDTNYSEAERQYCGRLGASAPRQCDASFRASCGNNPFFAGCLTNNTYAVDRAAIISACLAEIEAGTQADSGSVCSGSVGVSATVGDCAADPFHPTNGCNTNAGFERTRTTRTALCALSATPFDGLCNNFAGIDAVRVTYCTTAETSFNPSCEDPAYPRTTELRNSFCAMTENLFTSDCTVIAGVRNARTALAELCSTNAQAEGCDQFADGEDGATIADCTSDLYNAANKCFTNPSFATLRTTRATLCESAGEEFNPLCADFPDIDDEQETYCSAGAGSFDTRCASDYADEAARARIAFALSCRTRIADSDCTSTSITGVKGGVTVAQCIANPYRRECYGTEDNRNQDFVDEVAVRDALCTGDNVYSALCLLNGNEIVAGVKAARVWLGVRHPRWRLLMMLALKRCMWEQMPRKGNIVARMQSRLMRLLDAVLT